MMFAPALWGRDIRDEMRWCDFGCDFNAPLTFLKYLFATLEHRKDLDGLSGESLETLCRG
jgi:hypothetical protein